MPNAGGLVIAPSIEVAEYMAAILEKIDGEKPTVVHNQVKNVESRIDLGTQPSAGSTGRDDL